MNVLIREWRVSFRSILVWSACLGLTGVFFLSIYPAFHDDIEPLLALMRNYPKQALQALGLGELAGLQSFGGFYSFMIVYPLLCACIQALILGVGVISKEAARKTGDFLFTKPVSRTKILLQKYAATLCGVLLTGLVYTLLVRAGCALLVKDFDAPDFWLLSGSFLLTQVFCVSIGFLVGCLAKRLKSPTGVGIGIGALFFGMQMLVNMTGSRSLRFLSPMSYLAAGQIVQDGRFDPVFLAALLLLSVAFTAGGVLWYRAKDLSNG